MVTFDFDSEQASTQWLTQILHQNGYLQTGAVTTVKQETANVDAGASARIYALTFEYSPDSTGARPSNCLMKVAKSGNAEGFETQAQRYAAWLLLPQSQRYATLHKEPIFYEAVRSDASTLPLIPCFGSEVDVNEHYTCLLLEDFSNTHAQPPWPIPPEQKYCEASVRALAQLHAHWWNNEAFGTDILPLVNAIEIDEIVSVYQTCFTQFGELLGDRLSPSRRSIYERSLAKLPGLLASRFTTSTTLTLSHGDAHHWNMLLPTAGDEVVIFDWQTWHVDMPTHDLAYLMGVLWYSEHRARQESSLLRHYQQTLSNRGVDYSWPELVSDYRLSVLRHLFTPVIFSSFVMPAVWWPQLDRVFNTFDDWNCATLLE